MALKKQDDEDESEEEQLDRLIEEDREVPDALDSQCLLWAGTGVA